MTDDRLRRWRLVLGGDDADGTGAGLEGRDAKIDGVLASLYDAPGGDADARERRAGLGASAPRVARWLGDIRTYFPSAVVEVMQRDAVERLDLERLLLEPEILEAVEPDVHLVSTLVSLGRVMPERTRETARVVVRKVVDDLERRLAQRMRQAVTGALDRSSRTRRPRPSDIDWRRTIHANLRHYQPEYGSIVPERLVGYGRRRHAVQRDIVLCVDQSGSMASSVVHAGVVACVLASIPAVRTSLVVFDTAVADLTELLADPVDVLFGTQLGGGTDIDRALAYCAELVQRPRETLLVLVSDLFEGGDEDSMLARARALVDSGVRLVVLLALSDDGAPSYSHATAAALAALGAPAFACTPDLFPELMAAAIEGRDIGEWASSAGVAATRAPHAG